MRDFAAEMAARNKADRSRQEKINNIMCKPGYTWNETVKKCLGPAGYGAENIDNPEYQPQPPANSENKQQSAGMEIAKQAQSRKSGGMQAQQ